MILRNTTESGERSVRHRPLCRSRGTATEQWRYQWSLRKCFWAPRSDEHAAYELRRAAAIQL